MSAVPKSPAARTAERPAGRFLVAALVPPLTLLAGSVHGRLTGPGASYFAHKRNIFNIVLVKHGWLLISLVWLAYALRQRRRPAAMQRCILRFGLASLWWIVITQWAMGSPVMDRVFTNTGGKCHGMDASFALVTSSAACRQGNGTWTGGHDLSGHVFMLSHGGVSLLLEIVPEVLQHGFRNPNVKVASVFLASWWYMLLMTAAFFHTFFEKLTGLLLSYVMWVFVYVGATNLDLTWLGQPEALAE